MTPRTLLILFVMFVFALVAMMLDNLIWSISGTRPYFSPRADIRELYLGITAGALFAAALLFTGHRAFLPLALLVVITAAQMAGWFHFFEALNARGEVTKMTFYVHKVDLVNNGRHFKTRRFRAEAILIDRDGRRWELYGRYAYILPLSNQDCLTLDVRTSGRHAFPAGPFTLSETPYIDSIRDTRHPERCFAPAATPSQ